ncbi:hypothetical protein [Novosphingobium panipatense]|uniref:hypothetical protein n=1 Tax=Novosphingobium panipatense TaxID=428991 RepID=UPI00360E79A1
MQNLFRILFWLALVLAVTMAVLPHPPTLPGAPSDKLQHMMAFATLAVLAVLGHPRVPKLVIALALVALGGAIEVVQMIPLSIAMRRWRIWWQTALPCWSCWAVSP